MARYRMEGGSVVDTQNASECWHETRDWDGNNHVSRNTRDQWSGQTLYRSRKGRYYIEHYSSYQGGHDHAEWVSPQDAVRWLLLNHRNIPSELTEFVEQVSE